MISRFAAFSTESRIALVSASLAGLGFLSSCASAPTAPGAEGRAESKLESSANSETYALPKLRKDSTPMQSVVNPSEIVVSGIKLEHTDFDYPVSVNSRVEYWIDYFTGRGRKHFVKYLERSELFIPYIRPILKQNGLPEDLVYLAMIESGFNNHARSFAKAVGPWQFISATGKRYGLAVNWWVDERRDTKKSTLGAAAYLRDLYQMFNSWELAAAAYNAGEFKVAKAIRRYGTTDFWTIARQKYLRQETRDYVPKIIAAALISKNRKQFGFAERLAAPSEGEAVAPDGEVVKIEKETAQNQVAAAKEALESVLKGEDYENVSDQSDLDEGDASLQAQVSVDSNPGTAVPAPALAKADGKSLDPEKTPALARPIPTPHVNKKGEVSGEELVEFEVRSPADLLKISRAAGLSYHTVKSLNPELLRWCTPPAAGAYRVKLPMSSKDRFLGNYNSPAFQKRVEFLTYKVRNGQSLQSVARNFGIRVDPLVDLNGVSARAGLRQGALVKLPMPADKTRSIAALEIRDPPERRSARRKVRGSGRARKRQVSQVSYQKRAKARRTASY